MLLQLGFPRMMLMYTGGGNKSPNSAEFDAVNLML